MKLRWSTFCIVFISLYLAGFLFPTSEQDETSIKVISAHRTKELSTGMSTITPTEAEKNVLLVLRIEGISLEEFQEVAEKDEIYVIAGENQYKLRFRMTVKEARIGERVISPWIVVTFSVPEDILKMELVVGNYPHTVFEAEKEISDSLNDWDIKL